MYCLICGAKMVLGLTKPPYKEIWHEQLEYSMIKKYDHTKLGLKCCDSNLNIKYTLFEGRETLGFINPYGLGTRVCGGEPGR